MNKYLCLVNIIPILRVDIEATAELLRLNTILVWAEKDYLEPG